MSKMPAKQDICTLKFSEIERFMKINKQQTFRSKQIYEWLWKQNVRSFDDMSNLSKELRTLLSDNFAFFPLTIKTKQQSSDQTIKTAFELTDGLIIESVLIPSRERATACISVQVGCPLECRFCATGKLGFKRNLTISEIYDQVIFLKQQANDELGLSLTNVVFMGMGEPLLNYDNVLAAIDHLTDPKGLGMSPTRITLSTVGIPYRIRKLADAKVKFNLAVSLHTANARKRDHLMPINIKYPLEELSEALQYFHEKTGSRIIFEYLLLNTFNDSIEDASEFARFCRSFPVKVNLITYNASGNTEFSKCTEERLAAFGGFLEKRNMVVQMRQSKGADIDAACGQLANKLGKK